MDLCGPKIRTTRLAPGAAPLTLRAGGKLTIVSRRDVPSAGDTVGSIYEDLAKDLRPGHRVLFSDGLLEARVDDVRGDVVSCTVVFGGVLKGSQGINCPDSQLSARSVTEKDLDDLRFGVAAGADLVAVSFVQSAADIDFVRGAMRALPGRAAARPLPLIAKMELPLAVRNMHSIVATADGIMVARGDLGVELPPQEVPIAQKKLVQAANAGVCVCVRACVRVSLRLVYPAFRAFLVRPARVPRVSLSFRRRGVERARVALVPRARGE
jgi:pyruvate kinase